MEENLPTRHIPVLLEEVMRLVAPKPGETAVDATLGGGSYTFSLLEAVGPEGKVVALDRDETALRRFEKHQRTRRYSNLILKHANFSDLEKVLEELNAPAVDCIIADLGFSSDQISDPERGLSFMKDGPLDMRLDTTRGETAREMIARLSEDALRDILFTFGEEREASRIAKKIVEKRKEEAIVSTSQLRELVEAAYPKRRRSGMKIHPATKTFQALRIAVNQEEESLEVFLKSSLKCLRSGGRLGIVAFHSGEDRMIKRFFRSQERPCICPSDFPACACGKKPSVKIITKKAVMPTDKEQADNPRSRSAVLRVIEKL